MKKRGRKARQRQASRPVHGDPPSPPPPPAPPPAGSLVQGIRAFLGPHELLLLRCEGHIHYVGGSSGSFLVTVGGLPPEGPGRIGVTVPSIYPKRGVALDFDLLFLPDGGPARVNDRDVVPDASGWARVSVPPTRPRSNTDWTYGLEIERGSGLRGRFELDCLMQGGGEIVRSTLDPRGPAPAGPAPPAAPAPDPFHLPPEFVTRVLAGRYEEAYALCSTVYCAAVPFNGFVASLEPLVAASPSAISNNAVGGRGTGGGRFPFVLEYEGFDEVRTTVKEEPTSFLGRLFGGPKTHVVVQSGETGVEGSFTLACVDGKAVILDFHLRRFDDGGPSARHMRAVDAEMGAVRSRPAPPPAL